MKHQTFGLFSDKPSDAGRSQLNFQALVLSCSSYCTTGTTLLLGALERWRGWRFGRLDEDKVWGCSQNSEFNGEIWV